MKKAVRLLVLASTISFAEVPEPVAKELFETSHNFAQCQYFSNYIVSASESANAGELPFNIEPLNTDQIVSWQQLSETASVIMALLLDRAEIEAFQSMHLISIWQEDYQELMEVQMDSSDWMQAELQRCVLLFDDYLGG